MIERIQPTALRVSWAHTDVLVGGQSLNFRDCKVWPGGAESWDWRVSGTHHDPGIQPADILDLLSKGAEELVLSRGMQALLGISPTSQELLHALGIPYHIAETRQAVALFNRLHAQGRRVGGLFHSTC